MKRTGLLRLLLVPALVVGVLTPATAQQASAAATRIVTINKVSTDSGTGTVFGSATGTTTTYSCGPSCTTLRMTFPRTSTVTLTATGTSPTSKFTGWTVAGSSTTCPGTGSCSFTLLSDTSVNSAFAWNSWSLSVTRVLTSGAAWTNDAGSVSSSSTFTTGSGLKSASQISCGTTCAATYLHGTSVTLTAAPVAPGYVFAGWSGGGCSGSASICTTTVTAAASVTASFAPTFVLSFSKLTPTGVGTGTVSSAPSGISCASGCIAMQARYAWGTSVTLTAIADAGNHFDGWSGGTCSGTASTCTVSMTTARTVSATFLVTNALAISKTGNGLGTVVSGGGEINCGSTCSAAIPYGRTVTLQANPTTGSHFDGWSGACTGTGSCTVSMTEASSVTASFTLDRHTLTVLRNGNGAGSVGGTGIACGIDCSEIFDYGTSVTLTASPAVSSLFSGWSGGGCTGTGTCFTTITAATSVTATFTLKRFDLMVRFDGAGSGTVVPSPAASCSDDCARTFDYGTVVTLSASALAGSRFMGWTGDCSPQDDGTCTTTVESAATVHATFAKVYDLGVEVLGSGGGNVVSSSNPDQPLQIDCGSEGAICTRNFLDGATVTLVATADPGSRFTGWSGCQALVMTDASTVCSLVIGSTNAVKATFTALYALSVTVDADEGSVSSAPGGIDCGDTCEADFLDETEVVLTAVAEAGWRLTGWDGGCVEASNGSCTATMTGDRAVSPVFTPTHELSVSLLTSNGSGSVASTVDSGHAQAEQIDCGTTACAVVFLEDAVVTLTAAPGTGSYVTWGGACASSMGNTCQVTVTDAVAVTATFTLYTYELSVTAEPETSGTISGPAIDCGGDCSGTYDHGDSITLTASPITGWETTWSGECTVESDGTCTVSMTEARDVTATFTRIIYGLSVDLDGGTGTGRVASSSDPDQEVQIDCTADCTASFPYETVVTLTATPDSDTSSFEGWSSNCAPLDDAPNMCETTVLGADEVFATFTLLIRTVDVSFSGAGSGSVTSGEVTPLVDCASPTACSAGYDHFSEPTLTATADDGSRFMGWGEDCTGVGNCDLTMTADHSVTADFAEEFDVSVSVSGNGSGAVSSSVDLGHSQDAQITGCSTTCVEAFLDGATVTLTADPDPGSYVTWGGACEGETGDTCELAVDGGDLTAQATLTLERHAITIVPMGNGAGSVSSTSAPTQVDQIDCGSDCTATYDYGTLVTLTALASDGSTFTGWVGGACSGTGPCTVTVTAAEDIEAHFMVLRTLTVTRTGNGASYGRVVSTPSGLDCQAASCTATFVDQTALSLAASASTGATFTSWGGACSDETGPTCVFTIGEDTSVSAAFTLDVHNVTLNISGSGAGSVAISSGPTTTCSSGTCELSFDYGTAVTFTATPATSPLSSFGGWTGACSSRQLRDTCALTISGDVTLTATFTKVVYALSLTKTGLGGGNGTVTVDGGAVGGTCGTNCSSGSWTYDPGTVVTLSQTAVDDGLSYFDSWSGATCSEGTQTGSTCTVTMSQALNITATFAAYQSLEVAIDGVGVGSVMGGVADGPAIDCPGSACAATYRYGAIVSLYPLEGQDSVFGNWSGSCTGTGVCSVAMNGAKSVTAIFNLMPMSVTVQKQSVDGGGGTVTSTPAGINCGSRCTTQTASFPYSVQFSVTATADSGSYFVGWSGDTCEQGSTTSSSGGTCYLTPYAPMNLTAIFGTPTLYLTKVYASASASGSVSSSPSGISCATKCMSASGTYALGRLVTLTAKPGNGSVFSGWSGACTGLLTCIVTMDGLKYVTATFGVAVNLTVARSGSGSGSVVSSPAGINCGTTCSTSSLGTGTVVVLTATPASGSTLGAWSGVTCSEGTQSGSTCTFTLAAATTVTATFGVSPSP